MHNRFLVATLLVLACAVGALAGGQPEWTKFEGPSGETTKVLLPAWAKKVEQNTVSGRDCVVCFLLCDLTDANKDVPKDLLRKMNHEGNLRFGKWRGTMMLRQKEAKSMFKHYGFWRGTLSLDLYVFWQPNSPKAEKEGDELVRRIARTMVIVQKPTKNPYASPRPVAPIEIPV